ncbi:MAG TPA: hypothetical protein VFY18_12815 [Candidatus Limnocylindrales bacterium]|nr:hypothetical protein [Candidatus Limnocylindrales bacterium]
MEIAIFLVIAAVLMAVGVRIGMLVAPRLTRWAERADEEPHDD